jgi:branched-chain amino acid transport system substrate-binding protein
MKNISKKLLLFVCLGVGVQFFASAQKSGGLPPLNQNRQPNSSEKLIVKIGHVGPTSGPIAHLGKDNENGAIMAIEELNAAGTKIGGKTVTFVLLAEDDAADPRQGIAVAKKLADAKVAGVIGHLNSGTSIPASKIYSDAGIPQISPSATNPKYTRQGFKTTFRVVGDDFQLGIRMGKFAVATLQDKAVAVVDDRTLYGEVVAEAFVKGVEAAGGKIVAREFTTDRATDFRSILTRIRDVNPDLVFFGGMDYVAAPMLKQMKSMGINSNFMGGDGICSTELIKLAGNAAGNDQVFCAEVGGVSGEAKAGMDNFKAKFKTKFGVDVQVYAPYVYDATKLMVAAMVRAGSTEPANYLPVLANTTNYNGVTGPITFDEIGGIKNAAFTLKTIRSGQLVTLAVIR